MIFDEHDLILDFDRVCKSTDKGVCIQVGDKCCWLPKRFVDVNLEEKTVTIPDWVNYGWVPYKKEKKHPRRTPIEERIDDTMDALQRFRPSITLKRYRGKYAVMVNGRKKHWDYLNSKEAHAVLVTLLALVKP